MINSDSLIIGYTDNSVEYVSERKVNINIPEDNKAIEWDGEGNFDDYMRSVQEHQLRNLNLTFESAKVYIAVSNSELSDHYYAGNIDIEEFDPNSTAKEVYQQFHSRFPESVKPMIILKLYYVTRQI